MDKIQLAEVALQIVSFSGDARTLAREAISLAKDSKFDEAEKVLNEARTTITNAHHLQTDMVSAEANGTELELSVLVIHGQDHLMTSMVVIDLAEEFIDLYKRVEEK